MKFEKFEIKLEEDQRAKFNIRKNNSNMMEGIMPIDILIESIYSMYGKRKLPIQKVFNKILLDTFKPVISFLERYGMLEDSCYDIKRTVETMIGLYENYLLSIPKYRIQLWLNQRENILKHVNKLIKR